MRILLTGGGTGGHIFPLFAVAKEIRKIQQEDNPSEPAEFLFIGALNGLGEEIFSMNNIPAKSVLVGKLRRYLSFRNFVDIFFIGLGFLQALWKILLFMPDVVFSKGGYGSVPVVVAAWVYRIPIIIHDSDAVPGLANRFLSFFARRIAVSFEQAAKHFKVYKVAVTGNPIREDLLFGTKEKAKELFGISLQKPVLLITGGSQGARKINDSVIEILPQLLKIVEVIHQTGQNNFEEIEKKTQNLDGEMAKFYHPVPFFKEGFKDALAVSDLILSRAGSTINEIAAVGRPSILIPIEKSASDHQRENAYVFARAGASLVIEEPNLTSHLLLGRITELIHNQELLKKMGEHAKKISRPEAAKLIAQEVLKLGSGQDG